MSEPTSFGAWARQRRRLLDLTREELAGRVGCAAVTIRRIEAGERRPSKQLAARLADALELGLAERSPFLLAARRELELDRLPSPRCGLAGAAPPGVTQRPGVMTSSEVAGARLNRGHTRLPAQLTALIGRDQEVAQVGALLRQHDRRLVTLTGPGGIGKTRLALAAAEQLQEAFADGVLLIELAPLSDAAQVLPTIAKALGRSDGTAPLLDDLAAYLHDKCMLLLLDNLEHVLDVSPVLARLLAAAPRLSILVTSRATLCIPGEYEFVVPPLALPDPQGPATAVQLHGYAAVVLFTARARAARSSFELNDVTAPFIASICRRLEGLPLAIELAAASISALSAEQLATRLAEGLQPLATADRTAPPRHQTLEATLDWSYHLLAPEACAVLRRLAVFVSGCSLAAAEAVCAGDGVAPQQLLALLSELRRKSLLTVDVRHGEARYRMLELVRQYARRQLEATGELAQAEANHMRFFAALIEQARPHLVAADQGVWFERLTLELDNLRAALERALAQARADPRPAATIRALAMPTGLERFWSARGYSAEGAARLWSALALPAGMDQRVAPVRAAALNAVSVLAMLQGRHSEAWRAAEEARAYGEAHANPSLVFTALRNLGTIAVLQRETVRGEALLRQCLELGATLGPQADHGCAWALSVLGSAVYLAGDYARAQPLVEQSVALLRALGDANILALALRRLGQLALYNGEYRRARTLFEESLALNSGIDSPSGIAACLIGLAGVLLAEGQSLAAARLLGAARTVLAERAEHLTAADLEMQQRQEQRTLAQLGPQPFAALLADGRAFALAIKSRPGAERALADAYLRG